MRNAVQRRNHKERAQPLARSRHGLLEKHSDYSLRAADHRAKKKRIKILREKARDRNPDEFNFGMMKGQVGKDGTRMGDRGNTALDHETVQLLKTQDEGYLRTILSRTRKEVERAVGSLKVRKDGDQIDILGDDGARGRKTVFVTSLSEQDGYKKDEPEDGEDEEEDLEDLDADEDDQDNIKPVKATNTQPSRTKAREKEQRKLEALKRRQQQLIIAQRELDLQRAKMSNSIGGINKNGVKFKVRERKR
jgi:U3 small nucleolar RNA-associated protein 11